MKLEQEFTIPAEVDRAWEVLLDVTRIAPCFPGASLTSFEGDSVTGSVKVKLGPVLLTYKGVARFEERDAANRRVIIDARGTELKGGGSASARVTATLYPSGPKQTTCSLVTELTITGRAAQFGRGMISEIGNKIIGQFAANLAANLAEPARQPVATAVPRTGAAGGPPTLASPAAPPEAEALDLLDAARGSIVKRLAPIAVIAIAVGVVIWWMNR